MKMRHVISTGLVSGLLTVVGIWAASADGIKPGDTVEMVIRELGKPQGRISAGIYEVYLYDRGKVELVSNRVTTVDLITAEEASAKRLAQEKRQQEAAQRAKEAQERRQIEGNRILTERLADTFFRAQSAGEQLDYWDIFKAQYPEIDIGSIYAPLSRQYQSELEQARIREQLANLQQRTAAAEERAARAERAAEDAYWSRPPIVTYVPVPWVQGYHHDYPRDRDARDHTNTVSRLVPANPQIASPPSIRKIPTVNIPKAVSPANTTGTTVNAKSGSLSSK